MHSSLRIAAALVAGVALGSTSLFIEGARKDDDSARERGAGNPAPSPPHVATLATNADALDAELRGAIVALTAELQRVSAVQREHAALLDALGLEALPDTVTAYEVQEEPEATGEQAAAGRRETAPRRGRWRGEPSVAERRAALIESGLSENDADRVAATVDRASMDRLALRYRAAREGWLDSPEFEQASAALPDERELVRREYGEDAYDRYLYALGRSNRIVVESVLRNSPAEQAGLQPGDTLLGIAGERVYSLRDLMRVATQGAPDEMVPLVAMREGRVVETAVPRGPLGIRAGRESVDPGSVP